MSQEREWGVFYFENRTKIPLLWSTKGLHVSWERKPEITTNISFLENEDSWGSLVRYKLPPNSYVKGQFPLHKFQKHCVLFVEILTPILNKKYPPPTQTTLNDFEFENDDDEENKLNFDEEEVRNNGLCKSYLIEYEGIKDIILMSNFTNSFLLFGNGTFTIEPILSKLFSTSNHKLKNNEEISLKNNISQVLPLLNNEMPNSGEKDSIRSSIGISIYENESIYTLRESIFFYQSLFLKLKNKLHFLIIIDEEKEDYWSKMNDLKYMIYFYLSQFILGTGDVKEVEYNSFCNWLDKTIETFIIKDFKKLKLNFDDTKTERNLNVRHGNGTLVDDQIDGIIILSKIGNQISKELRSKLKKCEGFPTLFLLGGLELFSNLYDVFLSKEKTYSHIMDFYSSSNRPTIMYYQNNSNQNSNQINLSDGKNVCKFFRECIDISIEALTENKNRIDMSNAIKKELNKYKFKKEKVKKEIDERKTKQFIWFFGLTNEIETVQNSINILENSNLNLKFIQTFMHVAKRDDFNNFSFQSTTQNDNEDDSIFKINYVTQLRKSLFEFLNNVPTIKNTSYNTYFNNSHNLKIEKKDIIVLCVELNSRVLITGDNGVFTNFMGKILDYTKNCVLFVDRVDRTSKQRNEKLKMIENLNFFYGDENDSKLDQELIRTQNIDKYFNYRFYYWSERDSKNYKNFRATLCK
eukprot:gene2481-3190_t